MTWTQSILVYVVVWWLLFFMALPVGVHSIDNGIPKKPYLAMKALIVTFLAILVTWGIDVLIASGMIVIK